MSDLELLRAYAKAELAAGRQISWTIGFAISRPSRKQIREWFPVPSNLSKAESFDWLVRKALEEVR